MIEKLFGFKNKEHELELLAKPLEVEVKDTLTKLTVRKLKTKDVEDFMDRLLEVQNKVEKSENTKSDLSYFVELFSVLMGINVDTFREIYIEDYPLIFAHFKSKNEFFLGILSETFPQMEQIGKYAEEEKRKTEGQKALEAVASLQVSPENS